MARNNSPACSQALIAALDVMLSCSAQTSVIAAMSSTARSHIWDFTYALYAALHVTVFQSALFPPVVVKRSTTRDHSPAFP